MKRTWAITFLAFTAVFVLSYHFSISADTWWHLSAGRWMVENKAVIQQDVFSSTRYGVPWQYPGVWVQVVMYWIFNTGGMVLLNAFVSVMILLTWGVVWYQSEGLAGVKAVLLVLAAVSALFYYVARPFLFTFLFFSIFLFLYRRQEEQKNWQFWLTIPLMVLWVNTHGGYIAGFLVWGVFFFNTLLNWGLQKIRKGDGEKWGGEVKRYLLSGGGLFAASLLNPSGLGLWQLFFSTIGRQAENEHILEWQSPDFHSGLMLPFLLLAVLALVVMSYSRGVKLTDILLLGGFLALGLISIRNIFFFSITAVVVLSPYASDLVKKVFAENGFRKLPDESQPASAKQRLLYNSVAIFSFSLAVVWAITFSSPQMQEDTFESLFPADAVAYIQEAGLPPEMFNDYVFGGYLTWALPDYRVFIDGRADLYQDEFFFLWNNTVEAEPGWQQTLDDWEIGFVLIKPTQPLAKLLPCYGWQEAFADEISVIFVRSDAPQSCE